MRAKYGGVLRDFFNNSTSILKIIDLSDCQIFDSATVLTSIVFLKKTENKVVTEALRVTRNEQHKLENLAEFFKRKHIKVKRFPSSSWIISDQDSFQIKTKVIEQGIAIKDWGLTINRGILTGFNNAFIIDEAKKNELISEDPKSEEIIKPILRGRDINRYSIEFCKLWIISTFPSLKIDIENYPAVKKYLESFGKRLEQSGEKGSRKKTSGKWFEIQDSIAYWEEFEKPKIIYPNMTKFLPFTLDYSSYYTNQKCYILTGNQLEYLVAVFNSKLFKFCFEDMFPELQGNTRELNKVIFQEIPIKPINEKQEEPFKDLVDQILSLKGQDPSADTSVLEGEIDVLVYGLYGLGEEEIGVVENS